MTVMGLEFFVENGETEVPAPIVIKPQLSNNDDSDEEDFRPLVIDTSRKSVDEGLVLPSSVDSLHQPPSGREDSPNRFDREVMGLSVPMETVTLNPAAGSGSTVFSYAGGYFDTPGSRSSASSPASSVASLSTPSRGKNSAPQKTRRKNDKIMPVSDGEMEKYVCPVCSRAMFSQQELTKHIRSHNSETTVAVGSNTCTICGKVLSSQSSLDRHMLVHSGERPFKCKICHMAFTTNGNMHRHSRIHDKETEGGSSFSDVTMVPRPKVGAPRRGNKTDESRASSASSSSSSGASAKMQSRVNPDNFMFPLPSKRKLTFEGYASALMPAKRPNIGPYMYGPVDFPGMEEHTPTKVAVKQEVEDSSEEQFSCPMCEETFTCKISLENHLETHPEYTVKCTSCPATFKSFSELNVHVYMVHTLKRSNKAQPAEGNDNTHKSSLPIGFHELSFVDFTCDKFPLVAQAWCEDNPRRSSSQYHSFQCRQCDKCFPCSNSLAMHLSSHTDASTQCTKCHIFFTTAKQQKQHALEHNTGKIMTNFTHKASHDQEEKPQEVLSKGNFMSILGLKANQSEAKRSKPQPKDQLDGLASQIKEDYLNKNYFVKLGKAANLLNQPAIYPKKTVDENCNSFSSLSSIMNMASKMPDMFDSHKALGFHHAFPLFSNPFNTSLMYGHPGLTPPSMSSYLSKVKKESEERRVHNAHFIPISEKNSDPVKPDSSFHCTYCPETFNDLREFRSHERAHLGLATYRCDLCSYSTADKSTLIRHYRTHNGDRPYCCRLCDFAFTTKANCERHVRKKHHKDGKEEIEAAIGYSDGSARISDSDLLEGLAASETVCRYCGEDFKYNQMLRHHLKSQGGCQMKPYACKLCSHSFSNKVNALRHMQKQHKLTEPARMEAHIIVNEAVLERVKNMSPCVSPCPSSTSVSPAPDVTPPPESRMRLPIQPPVQSSPSISPRPLSISPHPQSAFVTYRRDSELKPQPLDFSRNTSPKFAPYQDANNNISDEPMDLSMKSKSDTVSPRPDVSKVLGYMLPLGVGYLPMPSPVWDGRLPHPAFGSQMMMQGAMLPPPPPLYPTPAEYSRYMRDLQYSSMLRGHLTNNIFQCDECDASFSIKTNLDFHLKLKHNQGANGKSKRGQATESKSDSALVFNTGVFGIPKSPANNGYNSDASCELAPVTRMLKTADSTHFKAFLHEENSSAAYNAYKAGVPFSASAAYSPAYSSIIVDDDEDEDEEDRASTADSTKRDMVTPPFTRVTTPNRSQGVSPGPNQSDDLSSTPTKKKRNSYADSPHKLECPYCPRAFPWVSSLNRHILTHTGHKPYKCPQCPVMFSTKSNRERHLVRKHGLNVLDPATRQLMDRPFKCHMCVFSSFSTAGNLLRHYREKHPETDLPEYLQYDQQSGTVEGSSITIEGGKKPLDLNDDEDYEEEEKDTVEDISMGSKTSLPLQMMSLPPLPVNPLPATKKITPHNTPPGTPERGLNPERDNYNVDKITDCWKCRQSFTDRKSLLKHLKEHNIDLPFKCYLCDASYDERKECLDHKLQRHPSDWVLLREKNNIKDVGDFAGAMNRIVECNFINRDGNGKLILEGDLAHYKGSLSEDLKPESDYLQRKVYCSLCPKRFWSLQDLRRHMRSHTGERPFECDICQKRFTLKHSMMRHRRKHANEVTSSAVVGSMSASDDENSIITQEDAPTMSHSISNHMSVMSSLLRPLPTQSLPQPAKPMLPPVSTPSASLASLFSMTEAGSDFKSSDILQNLLGVDNSAIDQMLDSADSAARLLGVQQ